MDDALAEARHARGLLLGHAQHTVERVSERLRECEACILDSTSPAPIPSSATLDIRSSPLQARNARLKELCYLHMVDRFFFARVICAPSHLFSLFSLLVWLSLDKMRPDRRTFLGSQRLCLRAFSDVLPGRVRERHKAVVSGALKLKTTRKSDVKDDQS